MQFVLPGGPFQLYAFSVVFVYLCLAGFYGVMRVRLARVNRLIAIRDEIDAAVNSGLLISPHLLDKVPERAELNLRLLQLRIRDFRLVQVLQLWAFALTLIAGSLGFEFYYRAVVGANEYRRLEDRLGRVAILPNQRVAHIQLDSFGPVRRGESLILRLEISRSDVSTFETYDGPIPFAVDDAKSYRLCEKVTQGLRLGISAPGFDIHARPFVDWFQPDHNSCVVWYNWIMTPKAAGNQVVAVQLAVRHGNIVPAYIAIERTIIVAEPASLDAYTPLIVAILSLAGAILTTLLSTLLARRGALGTKAA